MENGKIQWKYFAITIGLCFALVGIIYTTLKDTDTRAEAAITSLQDKNIKVAEDIATIKGQTSAILNILSDMKITKR